ncbi:FAST kinase domain-containing protein 4-like [Gigantopelta aegis]|uniref:FAST kinase domain-containing protein 4-like n=1 Tax=Gigantopelta aegis TaxID=1735272 RepID=UPI001B889357|nr:FAST kinase domain-containing protein 4-like [Gigantopelta aegis]XP_041372255.1 FAST kinase domain-containing protein 4-like [Gigantopelta aegis]
MPKDSFLLESLERQVLWSVRKWQIHSVIKLIEALHVHQETTFRCQMLSEAKSIIEKRWVEISNPYDIVSLMYIFDKPKDRVVFSKVQERALDLVDSMVPSSLYKVLYLSSKQKVRNTPLIRASVYHLNKKGVNLELFQLANLLYACSSLNIYDDSLLTTTLESIKDKLSTMDSPKTALMMLKSVSILRWHQNDAVDSILGYLGNHLSKLSAIDKVGIVLSIARLNHISPTTKKLVGKFSADEFKELKESSPMLYLDYVWSLCVLRYADESTVSSVLSSDFHSRVTGDSVEEYHRQVASIKLMNVQTSARHDLTSYSGPTLPADWLTNISQNLIRPGRPLSESVVSALTSTAPVDRFTKIDVLTPFGYFLDVEMFVNQSGQPLPYQQTSENKTPNTSRIGLKILNFPDMTQKSVHPVGLHVMARRHLEREGFTVVELPYHELSDKGTVVQKVQYIQNKIKQAVSPPTST